MKTRFFNVLFLMLALITLSFSSCQKEDQAAPSTDRVVGDWVLSKAMGTIYQDGNLIGTEELPATGGIEFRQDGTGNALFTLEIEGEEMSFVGPFTCKDVGFEIVWDEGTEDELRWSQDVDEFEMQVLRTTQRADGNPSVEAELTITLSRK